MMLAWAKVDAGRLVQQSLRGSRTVRRLINPVRICNARLSVPCARQYSSMGKHGLVQHEEALPPTDITSDSLTSKPALPPSKSDEKHSNTRSTWLDALECVLPPHLRREGSGKELAYVDERQALSKIILQARREADFDVLAHLTMTEKRADLVLWIVNRLLESPRPSAFFRDQEVDTFARWPSDQSLEQITSTSKAPDSLFEEHRTRAIAIADPSISLDDLTAVSQSALLGDLHQQSRDVLGELWRSLGHLIIVAASSKSNGHKTTMATVLRTVAQLHRQDYVPNKVFHEPTANSKAALSQPPFIQLLSADILMALTDTSVVVASQYGDSLVTQSPPFKSELWLEFILWCCVHGGWLREGVAIVCDLRELAGDTKWELVNWYTGLDPLAGTWNTQKARQVFIQHDDPSEELPEGMRVKHAISSEVVAALVDGLVSTMTSSTRPRGAGSALDSILKLKNLLGRSAMNLGVTSWDEIVARLAELPSLLFEEHASDLEKVLQLSENFGRENNAKNAIDKPDRWAASSAYIFDGSAATIGLYHRLLATYIQDRDTDSALRILAKLQHFTDENKTNALKDFLVRLTRSKTKPREVTISQPTSGRAISSRPFQNFDYPSFFPNIPPPILAALLDMVTDSRAFEIGDWMIHSEDIDGPMIPTELYGDHSIAPSLIRFAAEAQDSRLLKQLRRWQTVDVSGKTLVALTESHITARNWNRASNVLATVQTYSMHRWSEPDFARIVGALMRHMSFKSDSQQTVESFQLLHQILSGQFGKVWISASHRDSIVAVLSTIHVNLAELLKGFLDIAQKSQLDLSTESFEILLNRAVQTYGSRTGRLLWETWCRSELSYRSVREPDRSKTINIPISQRAESFSAGQSQVGPTRSPPLTPSFTGHVEATISTLRIIVQQALREYRKARAPVEEAENQVTKTREENHSEIASESARNAVEIFGWAEEVFARHFGLRKVDIEEELEDYFQVDDTSWRASSLYNKSTMRIWQAVYAASPTWAMAAENKMRVFVLNADDQIQFDPVDSAGRRFLHCLAVDFNLVSESFGDEEDRHVSVFKTSKTPVAPSITVSEAVRRVKKHSLSEAV